MRIFRQEGALCLRLDRTRNCQARYRHSIVIVASFLISNAGSGLGVAYSETLADRSRGTSTYTVVDQDLRDLLIEVGGQLGLRVSLSDALHGRVHGRLPDQAPREIIDHLATVYAFDSYVAGNVLYVSPTMEATSKILNLGRVPLEELRMAMANLGLDDNRWPLRPAGTSGLAAISGPPTYCAAVEQVLDALLKRDAPASPALHSTGVALFRGSTSHLK